MIEKSGNSFLMTTELREWWEEHKAADAKRILREEAIAKEKRDKEKREKYLAEVRDRLVAQLTNDEKESLNIK